MTLLLLALALAAAAPPAAAPNATASAAAAAGPAVFLHIPKTAGASVRSALREYCDGHRPGRPAPRRCCLGQTTAAAADAAAKCDLFAAHVRFGVSAPVARLDPWCAARARARGRGARSSPPPSPLRPARASLSRNARARRYATLLRDPVARTVSLFDYLWLCGRNHGDKCAARQEPSGAARSRVGDEAEPPRFPPTPVLASLSSQGGAGRA